MTSDLRIRKEVEGGLELELDMGSGRERHVGSVWDAWLLRKRVLGALASTTWASSLCL